LRKHTLLTIFQVLLSEVDSVYQLESRIAKSKKNVLPLLINHIINQLKTLLSSNIILHSDILNWAYTGICQIGIILWFSVCLFISIFSWNFKNFKSSYLINYNVYTQVKTNNIMFWHFWWPHDAKERIKQERELSKELRTVDSHIKLMKLS